jgi:hypothetical protein
VYDGALREVNVVNNRSDASLREKPEACRCALQTLGSGAVLDTRGAIPKSAILKPGEEKPLVGKSYRMGEPGDRVPPARQGMTGFRHGMIHRPAVPGSPGVPEHSGRADFRGGKRRASRGLSSSPFRACSTANPYSLLSTLFVRGWQRCGRTWPECVLLRRW